jgi:hypothetical protein
VEGLFFLRWFATFGTGELSAKLSGPKTGPAANIDGSRAAFSPSGQDAGESCSLSAMRAKSGKEEAFIFRMTWPRCTLAVTSLIPRS